jgi:hypothetical protein
MMAPHDGVQLKDPIPKRGQGSAPKAGQGPIGSFGSGDLLLRSATNLDAIDDSLMTSVFPNIRRVALGILG